MLASRLDPAVGCFLLHGCRIAGHGQVQRTEEAREGVSGGAGA